jgi:uncharacterized protein YndB with AHSA1/START domain
MRISTIVFTLLAITLSPSIRAEVVAKSSAGFVSKHTLNIAAPPQRVFEALTDDVGRWWNPEHSYSGAAANFSIDARAGGCFCERLKDGSVEHMTVVFVARNSVLRMIGGIGPLQSMAVTGSMTFALAPADSGGTKLQYEYAVGGYSPEGLEDLAEPVDRVQLGQLQRLQRFIETGSPDAPTKP